MSEASVPRGKLFVIAAPSGAGKTSLVRALMQRVPSLRFSISYTTRKPRPNEHPGRDYFFVDHAEFERMVDAGEFLEHARVFDNYYGTSRTASREHAARRRQRAARDRLAGRATDPSRHARMSNPFSSCRLREQRWSSGCAAGKPTTMKSSRAACAIRPPTCRIGNEFDFVVVNDDFERATVELETIVAGRGTALRRSRSELQTLLPLLLG